MIYDARTIGLRMKQLRKIRGLKQKEVADYLSITPAFYCQIESGKRNISLPQLMEFAELLKISVGLVLGEPVEGDISSMELEKEDLEILDMVRSMDKNQKQQVLQSLQQIKYPEIVDKPKKRVSKKTS